MHDHSGCCGCAGHSMGRRTFLASVGGTALGAAAFAGAAGATESGACDKNQKSGCGKAPAPGTPLVVQPALVYSIPTRREATSWRGWGGLHTQSDVDQEINRIEAELRALAEKAEFPITFRPVARVTKPEEGTPLRDGDADVMLIYAASAGNAEIEALIKPERPNLMFVRHKSGPVYLYYEIAHPVFLRKWKEPHSQPGIGVHDIVVDSQDEIEMRLRALYGLRNTVGSKIIAIGDAAGWGAGGKDAPKIAVDQWKLDIINEPYDDLGKRIVSAKADAARVKRAEAEAAEYLKDRKLKLQTGAEYVQRAFLLHQVFQDLMEEHKAPAITINNCMSTIMPMSETTACLVLTLLNDAGVMAFCESDFVVIPSGILLRHIASKPVFLNDPTYPHDGVITLAHCTAPRRMDGKRLEKVRMLTHFESDYGAAPKVEMKVGQTVTVIDPDFASQKWIGFRGKILDNPFLDICRSQVDVSIEGDWTKLMEDMVGFHWMMSYGDYLQETGYALRRMGIQWENLTASNVART
ncbi:MAG: sugar isomerase [FCB group bacterium]|nr:sugar isomerase [FCB group bacterium]